MECEYIYQYLTKKQDAIKVSKWINGVLTSTTIVSQNNVAWDRLSLDEVISSGKVLAYDASGLMTTPIEILFLDKIKEINTQVDLSVKPITDTYPKVEQMTFDQQYAEADKYTAWMSSAATGTPPNTPILSGISLARGVELTELCRRVLVKRDTFAETGLLIGHRQRAEDLLYEYKELGLQAQITKDLVSETKYRTLIYTFNWNDYIFEIVNPGERKLVSFEIKLTEV